MARMYERDVVKKTPNEISNQPFWELGSCPLLAQPGLGGPKGTYCSGADHWWHSLWSSKRRIPSLQSLCQPWDNSKSSPRSGHQPHCHVLGFYLGSMNEHWVWPPLQHQMFCWQTCWGWFPRRFEQLPRPGCGNPGGSGISQNVTFSDQLPSRHWKRFNPSGYHLDTI